LKFLLLIAVIVLACWILKVYGRKVQRRAGGVQPPAGEDMVRCAHCGVHLPRSESLMAEQTFYCSADHRRLHQTTS
jgi:uncharacterized protein